MKHKPTISVLYVYGKYFLVSAIETIFYSPYFRSKPIPRRSRLMTHPIRLHPEDLFFLPAQPCVKLVALRWRDVERATSSPVLKPHFGRVQLEIVSYVVTLGLI
jgi:hypothetical protein